MVLSPPFQNFTIKFRADSVRQVTDHVKDAEDRTETSHRAMCRLLIGCMFPGRHADRVHSEEVGTKVRVDNVHYDLSEEDLQVRLLYNRYSWDMY